MKVYAAPFDLHRAVLAGSSEGGGLAASSSGLPACYYQEIQPNGIDIGKVLDGVEYSSECIVTNLVQSFSVCTLPPQIPQGLQVGLDTLHATSAWADPNRGNSLIPGLMTVQVGVDLSSLIVRSIPGCENLAWFLDLVSPAIKIGIGIAETVKALEPAVIPPRTWQTASVRRITCPAVAPAAGSAASILAWPQGVSYQFTPPSAQPSPAPP